MTAAAAMSSALGKQISRLAIQGRSLVWAFGDYDLDLGPLAMATLDLDTLDVSATEATLTTEQLWTLRLIDGQLYAPFLDPRGTNSQPENGQYAARADDGTWTTVTAVSGVTHAFDFAISSDGAWLFGANEAEGAAVIWRSTDNQATWAESLRVTDAATAGGDGPRFYAVAQFGDDMIAFGRGFADGTLFAYRWTASGDDWVQIDPYPVNNGPANEFAITDTPCSLIDGTLYVVGLAHTKDSDPTGATEPWLIPLDGDAVDSGTAGMPASVYDVQAGGGALWLLDSDHHVRRAGTDGAWTDLGTLDDNTAISIAVDTDGGFLYFGTTDSRIVRTAIPT